MSSRRPRRSRIYDLNYNIGENLYKSALDRLNEKTSLSSSSSILRRSEPPAPLSQARFTLNDEGIQDDLDVARERAKYAIQKETVLDQRTGRRGLELEGNFDDQVQRTLDRIQASKKLLNSLDLESEQTSSHALASSSVQKRVVKVTTESTSYGSNRRREKSYAGPTEDSESFAVRRMQQSAARLNDIERDMVERNERQFAREQRAANVKKLLAETSDDIGLENGVSSLKITKSSQKRITAY